MVGWGLFGTVHLAMNNTTGSLFVVKSTQSRGRQQFLENEAEILESLISPHIVRCLGRELLSGGNGKKELNLFFEYMAGGSLSAVAEKFGGALDERDSSGAEPSARERNRALRSQVRERALGSSGDVKLADFGCAKRLKDLKKKKKKKGKTSTNSIQSSKSVAGTPLWMAPEILRNEGLDSAADIWSLGCTVVEMATGKPPWGTVEVSNPLAVAIKIACSNEGPWLPPDLSEEALDFLEKCLRRNPGKRWTAKKLLNHPLASGIKEEEACSPACILDVRICEEGFESDYESLDEGAFSSSRIPFCGEERWGWPWMTHQMEINEFSFSSSGSGNWITVRSG